MGSLFTKVTSNLIGFVYPAYASFKAIESDDKHDDTQWLTYWVVYAFFNLIESLLDFSIGGWIPFYFFIKVFIVLWLQLPQFMGALYIYQSFLAPLLRQHEKQIDSAIDAAKSKTVHLPGQAIQYAVTQGPQALFKMQQQLGAAENQNKK